MKNNTILNACNIPLNTQAGSIPDVGVSMADWFQPMTFTKVVKHIVAFRLVETSVDIKFIGVIMPLSGRELSMRPDGERQWNWVSLYAQGAPGSAILNLQPDEVVIYQGTQYRVMASRNFGIYGYINYDLVSDYQGSGPPTL